jgi:thiosulfate dehydrogenase [quinone] large subunit
MMALLRIFTGVQFIHAGVMKWDWIGTGKLAAMLSSWAANGAFAGYNRLLIQDVLPHAALFTYLVVFGEVCVGTLLVLGLLTRLAALLALVMNVNYLLATWHLGTASQGFNESLLVIEIALIAVGAGRALGMDAPLARNKPGGLLW